MTDGAQPLDAALDAALARVAEVPRLLVALDFDGTLAPEVDDPEHARALPAAVDAIARLRALPHTTVALVSGRSLASLARVAEVGDDVPLIGSHGLEVRVAAGEHPSTLTPAETAQLDTLRTRVATLVDPVVGAWIEDKPAGFAVHLRLVERSRASALETEVRAVLDAQPGLTVRAGKNVVELALRDATKGDGLRALRARVVADAVVFAGDDVTDEDGFAALGPGDVGIKVGTAPTVASFRVADPVALVEALRRLISARESSGSGR